MFKAGNIIYIYIVVLKFINLCSNIYLKTKEWNNYIVPTINCFEFDGIELGGWRCFAIFFSFLGTSKIQWPRLRPRSSWWKKLGLSGAILSLKIQDQDREKISGGNPADYACTTCLSYDRVKSFSFSWLLCRLSSIPFRKKYLALISHNTGHLSSSSPLVTHRQEEFIFVNLLLLFF